MTVLSILLTVLISIPLGDSGCHKAGKVDGSSASDKQFYRQRHAEFLRCYPADGIAQHQVGLAAGDCQRCVVQSAIMPTLTLAISMSAKYMRQVRATVLEELNKDYVIGLKARGVRSRDILWKNVMKSAMVTILTLLALSIGSLLGGTAIIESILYGMVLVSWQWILFNMRDYPMILAYVVWIGVVYVLVNLVTDAFIPCAGSKNTIGGRRQSNEKAGNKNIVKFRLVAFASLAGLFDPFFSVQ